jgi:P-type Mg2+ transporter
VVRISLYHDPLQSILFAVALAVGLTPEFLPMIASLTLAKGALRMARKKVTVRQLAAIQDFGCMDVLCSDKLVRSLPATSAWNRRLPRMGSSQIER